jgi:hypothetical protein
MASSGRKPLLSLSLDLDNLWTYLKVHGDPGWVEYPSFLDAAVTLALDRFERHQLPATFFIVGRDADHEAHKAVCATLGKSGHEIGNHSYSHEPWAQRFSRSHAESEILAADRAIEAATGKHPRGFRGPGYSLSRGMLEVLVEAGYQYDATTFPTFLGPLARRYYFRAAPGLSEEERQKRGRLFGTLADGRRPLRPYFWQLDKGRLLEIPVTTMPILRAPFHQSYLLYLSKFSRRLSLLYLEVALSLCRRLDLQPSFLLHPLDFLGGDDVDALSFFPGMAIPTQQKLLFLDSVLAILKRRFDIVNVGQQAQALLESTAPTLSVLDGGRLP